MIRTLLKPFSFLPALILMYVIYNFSAQPANVSSQLSFQVSCKLVEAADYVFDANLEQWEVESWATRIHFITRKLAHMTIYFALAVAVSFPLYVYGIRGIWLMLLAGLICVGFACGDEYHQSYVDGRSPSKRDVAIDAFGVFWGIILVRIVGWTGRKTIFRPRKKKEKVRKSKTKSTPEYGNYPPMPSQNQGYQQPFPPQGQGYQQPFPLQGQGYRQPFPPQSQGYQQPFPPQSQGYQQPSVPPNPNFLQPEDFPGSPDTPYYQALPSQEPPSEKH